MKTYRDASKEFEPKWRQHWDTQNIFKTPNPSEEGFDKQKPKFVVLDMFPYPKWNWTTCRAPTWLHCN